MTDENQIKVLFCILRRRFVDYVPEFENCVEERKSSMKRRRVTVCPSPTAHQFTCTRIMSFSNHVRQRINGAPAV